MPESLEDNLLGRFVDRETALSLAKRNFSPKEIAQILGTSLPRILAHLSGNLDERTLKETFTLVQELHLYLCHNPKYSKLPFSERDKIIAGCEDLQITPARASQARRGVGEFEKLAGHADSYVRHNKIPKNKLFEIIQSAFYTIKSDSKYKGRIAPQLDDVVAGWLGYQQDTITHYKVGVGHYKNLRGLVPDNAREARYGSSDKTYVRVRYIYLRLWKRQWFRALPKEKRDEIVAGKARLKPMTIIAIRNAYGTYKKFGGF